MLDFQGAQNLISPQSEFDPLAALHMLTTDPEAIIPHLAAAGISPPDRSQLTQLAGSPPRTVGDGTAQDAINSRWPLSPMPPAAPGSVAPPQQAPEPPPMTPAAFAQPPKPQPAAYDEPLPVTPTGVQNAQQDAAAPAKPEDKNAPGSKTAIDNAIRALQGVKMPPAPVVQKLDSPRVTAGHAISQNAPAVAALMHQLLGGTVAGGGPLRLGQALK